MARLMREMNREDLEGYMTMVARATKSVVPSDADFVLIMLGEGFEPQYVSSVKPEDVQRSIEALRKVLRRLEVRVSDVPSPPLFEE